MTLSAQGEKTTTDTLLDGRVKIIQPEQGYRVAIDPVLLAASVQVAPGSRVLDVGCGTGAALFSVLARIESIGGVGLEQRADSAGLATQGIHANGLSSRAQVVIGDLADPPSELGAPFDAVMTNPPFFEAGTVPRRAEQDTAHAVMDMSLSGWIKLCLSLLKKDGQFAIIHRAERLSDIIQSLSGCGATNVFPLWPKPNRPAKRVVVTARKGRKSPTTLQSGLVLHGEDDAFTPEAEAILRDGAALEFLS